jgi:hypothetical protein
MQTSEYLFNEICDNFAANALAAQSFIDCKMLYESKLAPSELPCGYKSSNVPSGAPVAEKSIVGLQKYF